MPWNINMSRQGCETCEVLSVSSLRAIPYGVRPRSAERVRVHELHERAERQGARVLDVGLGDAPADAPVLVQDVGHREAQLALVVLLELLPERGVPQHLVLAEHLRLVVLEDVR